MTASDRLESTPLAMVCMRMARVVVVTVFLTTALPVRAENNTSLIIIGPTTTNIGGPLTIGSTGTNNSLQISNGGAVTNTTGIVGDTLAADFNYAVVSNVNSIWYNSGNLTIGDRGSTNRLIITDQGQVHGAFITVGNASGSSDNEALVTGSNSLLQGNGNFLVGNASAGNTLTISNGGRVADTSGILFVGSSATATSNLILITGSGSILDHAGSVRLGSSGSYNQLLVTNGGSLSIGATFTFGAGSNLGSSNTVLITGVGSTWTNGAGINFSSDGTGNRIRVEEGGVVVAATMNLSTSSNTVIVSGTGSTVSLGDASTAAIGFGGTDNQLIVSNGGRFTAGAIRVGRIVGDSSNSVLVTGAGSIVELGTITVGSNSATTFGIGGKVTVTDGATFQADTITMGFLNSASVSNNAGIYQFSTATPNITDNSSDSMVLVDGTISFRDVAAANVYGNVAGTRLTNVLFLGSNAFRLNNSSNTAAISQNYTFTTASGSTNYSRLEMVNGGSLWRSAWLQVGAGGSVLASNTVSTVAAAVTNDGTIRVVNSKLTWSSNMVISGSYFSDPSTNTFLQDVTLTSSGTLHGGVGDLFDFKKSLLISNSSNPSASFNLVASTVSFSGGGEHTNAITGDDFGHDGSLGFADGFTGSTSPMAG